MEVTMDNKTKLKVIVNRARIKNKKKTALEKLLDRLDLKKDYDVPIDCNIISGYEEHTLINSPNLRTGEELLFLDANPNEWQQIGNTGIFKYVIHSVK